jgi:uncharacterized protein DUF6603
VSDAQGTIETILDVVSALFLRLAGQIAPSSAPAFFAELGLPLSPAAASSLATALTAVTSALEDLATIRTDLEAAVAAGDAITVIEKTADVVSTLAAVITSFTQLAQAISSLNLPGVDSSTIEAIPGRILSQLLADYLSQIYALPEVLQITGILDRTDFNVDSVDPNKPFYTINTFNFGQLAGWLTNPADQLKTLYDWGNPSFNGSKLLPMLDLLAAQLGLPVLLDQTSAVPMLDLVDFVISPQTSPPGLLVRVESNLGNGSIELNGPGWTATVAAATGLEAGTEILIQPGKMSVTAADALNSSGALSVTFARQPASGPLIILSLPGGSVLQAQEFTATAGLQLNWSGTSADADLSFGASISGGELIIDMSEADGFLSDVTSGTPVKATFELAATWAPSSGLHVTGGAQLEIDLPLHLNLGPVTFDTIYIVGGIANGDLTLELSAALGVTLGPIQASVDRVGLLGTLSFPKSGGNIGFADIALGFKPPNGLGLSIDAGVISGGGYISFDPNQGQYAGVIQLTLLDIIGITVITVLDTKMPDGSSGFSLLFIITFTLPPIQLGFGFTLIGVGGIGGVNRTMDTNALQAGFMAHTLDAIMFPPNPIQNAPQIISDIRSFFPPADGRYLFGPLLEFGWGTPTLISMSVGAILNVPDPVVLALIGLIDAGLPTEDVALVELHIEVLGIIDFGAKYLSIEGTLYDSRVLIFSMGGSLALEVAWGDDPNFVFSLGGFNPNFNTAGLNIGPMARCSVSIGDGDNPRISANNYYAITSNSFQFGANVQAYASAAGFTIQGYLGFDVLIIISPFSFEFDFQAGFSVSFEGISLIGLNVDGLFSGPTPWHFHGDASISILFFTVSASLDLTWGDSTQATIPAKPVLPDLFAALKDPRNWNATLPAGASVGVSLVTLKPTDTTLRVHPMGTLTVREKVVPLDLPITKYGNATPSDGDEFSIQSVQINTQAETIQSVQDYFAIGQFETLSDSDKLSKPSFEAYDAGVTIGSATVVSGEDRARTVTYQEYYIDTPVGFSRFTGHYMMPAAIHAALSAQGAGFNSPLKNSGMQKYTAGPQPAAVIIDDPPYVIANITDLSVRSDISSSDGTTYFQAQAAMQSHLAANPNDIGTLQIVPVYELAA